MIPEDLHPGDEVIVVCKDVVVRGLSDELICESGSYPADAVIGVARTEVGYE